MNRKIKLIGGYTILFILSILLYIITGLFILNITVFKPNYILNKMDKNKYFDNLYDDIKLEMSYYTNQSGFDDDILDDTFTKKQVKKDVTNFIKSVYNNKKYEVDTSKFREKLNNKIDKVIEKNNFVITNRDNIDKFVDELAKIYSDKIKFMGYVDYVMKYFNKLITKVHNLMITLSFVFIGLILVNNFVFKRKDYNIVLFTSSMLQFTSIIYVYSRIKVNNILVYSKIFSYVIMAIIKNLISMFLILGIVYFILGIILCLFKNNKENRK